ncbi:MAG: ABC transporter substrate-binding protein [Moraxella sp.]|nr:ABC transporter substrate-binding protein [Moraxella sp.]
MNAKFVPSALLVALSAALFGCNNNQNTEAPAKSETPTPATTASADVPANELADVQEITINNGAEPESLDPHKVSGVPESNLIRQMLVGLTSSDADGKTIPGMATEWSSPDNKVWTFKLRDAKWSNGDPVTAEDFVFSFRRLTDPNTASPYATYLADAKVINAQDIVDGKAAPDTLGVKAIDDKTLEVTLSEPVPFFPDMLMHTAVKPVNPKTVQELGEKWVTPATYVVNGPYKLSEWQVNEKIVLERNPNYFDDAKTTINKVTFLAVPSGATELTRYKAGDLDVGSVDATQFEQAKAELGDEIKIAPNLCTYYYEFNHTKPPFDDVRVRKALSLVYDRDTVVNGILKQGQTVAYQFTPEATQGMNNYTPEWKSWDKAKRIEEAKKLLAEAGYGEGNPLKVELLYNTSDAHKVLAVASDSFWKEAFGGNVINVSLNNQEWKTYLETRRTQKHDIARGGWCADYNEASTFLNTFRSNNSSNYGKYNNPEFDRLLDSTLGGDVTPEQRAEIYKQAEAMLDKDSATIFVYQYVTPYLIKPYVLGFPVNDPLGNWHVKDLKIAKH